MKKYKIVLICANLVIVLMFFHYSVYQKEAILTKGQLVLLRLAPVDPRSLMQGDYMDLRYDISRNDSDISKSSSGYLVVQLDSGNVARMVRLQDKATPRATGEYLIKYSRRAYRDVRIGAESYFFEEGQGSKYDSAAYGGLRIDDRGNSVLTGLYDSHKQLIQ
ncbi:GDYXXLXY domain-containing protein [Paraflavitalea pollutisoli]|uniref:GDYXXLXY domain-containing protein n=1 Tax=Paraflavitalea pollutisoli TaxID=3034143 RepID=UPI0023EC0CCF|nr:GDYXXLXY domain-containing protein [Paraflavitalea sp. H1-2-19X]